MNIFVLLRAVPDPAGFTVNRKAQKIFVNRAAYLLNPSDRNALEAALQLAGGADSVTAVACGPDAAFELLQQARAVGAGRAIWVPTADPPTLDARGLTQVLRAVLHRAGPADLVLLGADVLDSDLAQVAPRLAAALDWPYVEGACAARPLPDCGLGLVVPLAGQCRLFGVDLPAVATVARDSNKPRLAPAARIITIYQDPAAVERLSLDDLELDPAGLAPVTLSRGKSFPPERTLGQLLSGAGAVRQLADALKGR